MKNWILPIAAAILVAGCTSGGTTDTKTDTTAKTSTATTPATGGKKVIAFVTNNASDFWKIAQKGTEKAKAELPDYDIEFKIPANGTVDEQKQILDDLLTNGVAGVAISPKDPANMTDELNKVAAKAVLFCQDSDAATSNRVCYIGTDNEASGEMAGGELKKALPNGGKVMVFVGTKDAQNAQDRFAGLKKAIEGTKIQILDLRTDEGDRARAKQNVADAITANPDLAACVGLYSYNGPAIASAVKEANKAGKVKVVCFDEEADTLAGVKDGTVDATIVQQPFEFGYQSMKMIAAVISGDKSGIPADKKKIIPTQVINKANVDDFKAKLAEQTK